MRNSSCQFEQAQSLQDGVKAKQKINALFRALKENLEDCVNFLADFRIADENELDIEKLSSEVR